MANKFVNEFCCCQRMTYCNNSMICIACEIKICSHVDYQKAFLRLTAIPAVGIAVNRK